MKKAFVFLVWAMAAAALALCFTGCLGFTFGFGTASPIDALDRGNTALRAENYDRAIAEYTEAIRLNKNYTLAYSNRGVAYAMKEDYDRAIADLSQAIRLEPTALRYAYRGNLYNFKGDWDMAISDAAEAIRLDPKYAEAYRLRGIAYREKGDYDRAIADFDQSLQLNPELARTYVGRGLAYHHKGDYSRAIADYEYALRLDSSLDDAKRNLELAQQRTPLQIPAQPDSGTGTTAQTQIIPAQHQPDQQMALDAVIKNAARGIEDALPQRALVAVLNFASPSQTFSDYVIEELTGELVTGRKVTIVDRRSLALISQEMNLQLSGDVSDESAQAIGRLLGAQSIVSGTLTNMGTYYRFRIRVISVETAAIQTQVSLDLQNDAQVAFLLGASPPSAPPGAAPGTAPGAAPPVAGTEGSTPPIEGIMVPGNNLAAKLTWLLRSADSHNTYILEATANESIAPTTLEFSGGINITVVLRGAGANRTIRLSRNGTMFTVNSNVTFILDNNITLQGHSGNNGPIVNVEGGTLKMNGGSAITGNARSGGYGGGVNVSGTFEMNGGTISGNTSVWGGGVYVNNSGTFTMTSGTISGNTANMGGGVYVAYFGTFTMRGGTITGNTAREYGGGLYKDGGLGAFTKNGGTITGYTSDRSNGNVVRDVDDYIMGRRGHAVYVSENIRKETTAGAQDNMSYGGTRGTTGAWDQ